MLDSIRNGGIVDCKARRTRRTRASLGTSLGIGSTRSRFAILQSTPHVARLLLVHHLSASLLDRQGNKGSLYARRRVSRTLACRILLDRLSHVLAHLDDNHCMHGTHSWQGSTRRRAHATIRLVNVVATSNHSTRQCHVNLGQSINNNNNATIPEPVSWRDKPCGTLALFSSRTFPWRDPKLSRTIIHSNLCLPCSSNYSWECKGFGMLSSIFVPIFGGHPCPHLAAAATKRLPRQCNVVVNISSLLCNLGIWHPIHNQETESPTMSTIKTKKIKVLMNKKFHLEKTRRLLRCKIHDWFWRADGLSNPPSQKIELQMILSARQRILAQGSCQRLHSCVRKNDFVPILQEQTLFTERQLKRRHQQDSCLFVPWEKIIVTVANMNILKKIQIRVHMLTQKISCGKTVPKTIALFGKLKLLICWVRHTLPFRANLVDVAKTASLTPEKTVSLRCLFGCLFEHSSNTRILG